MITDDCLTIDEMRAVTKYQFGRKMFDWFIANGFTAKMGRDGYPIILREHFKAVMSGESKKNVTNNKLDSKIAHGVQALRRQTNGKTQAIS